MIALANAAIAYALVSPSCSSQQVAELHVLSAGSLLVCLAVSLLSARNWLRAKALAGPAEDPAQARHRFLSQVATLCGLLSAFVVLAEWLPVWMVSPCTG
jgi:hypothetical protein